MFPKNDFKIFFNQYFPNMMSCDFFSFFSSASCGLCLVLSKLHYLIEFYFLPTDGKAKWKNIPSRVDFIVSKDQ